MCRFMMGVQIIFLLVFFTGIKVEATPMDECMKMATFEQGFESIINLAGEEQFKLFCTNMTSFLSCINNLMKRETGRTIKELAGLWYMRGTQLGKYLTFMTNLEDLVGEICTEGTQLHKDYKASMYCFGDNINEEHIKHCKEVAIELWRLEMYRLFNPESSGRELQECLTTAYQLGCLGAVVQEKCGHEALNLYKYILKKFGYLQSDTCSSMSIRLQGISFINSLKMPYSRKKV